MVKVSVIGIDLAKSVFQLHGNNEAGKTLLRKQVKRNKLLETVKKMDPCLIATEACGSAHYWGRKFVEMGHQVKLIPPQYVKPYVKTNKSDTADAEAIAEAATRPNMRFVPLKTIEQTTQQAMLRIRERHIGNRTALCNQIRGLLFEHGIVVNQGVESVRKHILKIIDGSVDAEILPLMRTLLADLHSELTDLEERIAVIDKQIAKAAKEDVNAERIQTIPGVGIITAMAVIAAMGSPNNFKNGRQFAVWLGLTPRITGTGGKNKLLGISKRGDNYLRSLLIHGARSALQQAHRRADPLAAWAVKLKDAKGWNRASVALANKNARMIWAILNSEKPFDARLASAA